VFRVLRRHLPVTAELHGQRFLVREGRRFLATPLLVTLVFVELTDIVFAVDSVPAIFGITQEPLIVFTSNVFAILGLRAMYFVLAGAMGKFHLLKYGLGVVLVFVGMKMTVLNPLWHGHFPIGVSLGVIVGVIAVAIALSLIFPQKPQEGS
jgi:tellurite resistance protein TerC